METLENKIVYKGYTHSQLAQVFDAVKNPQDWKAPILASMPGEAVLATIAAIEFFTATTPEITLDTRTMQYHVYSIGYRNGPAGDH